MLARQFLLRLVKTELENGSRLFWPDMPNLLRSINCFVWGRRDVYFSWSGRFFSGIAAEARRSTRR
jgi:hypothetical protein